MTESGRAQGAGQGKPTGQEDAGLAQTYQNAAMDDAYHERAGAGSAPGEQVSALVAKKGGEAAPSTDPAPEDKIVSGSHRAPADAANGNPTVSDEALQRGLTPGEMGAGQEPQERTKARLAPRYTDAELSGIESGETGEETVQRDPMLDTTRDAPDAPTQKGTTPEAAAPKPSRFTDAELSGLEPGETSSN